MVETVNLQRIVGIFGEPNVQKYRGGKGFIGALKVKSPDGIVMTAVGFDMKKKGARLLTLYHTHLIMKAFDEHKAKSSAHQKAAGSTSPPAAPMAPVPPVMFAENLDRLSGDLPTLGKEATESKRQEHLQCFLNLKLPVVGDPVFDRSAALVLQYEGDDEKGIRNLWKTISTKKPVTSKQRNVWIARMKVPGYTNFPAVGVSETLKHAEHRCYLHALLMTRMAKEGSVDLSGLAPTDASIMAYYLKATGCKTLVESVPNTNAGTEKRYQRTRVTIGEYSAEAEAINEIEAQKKAVVAITREMMRDDQTLKNLLEFAATNKIELSGNVPQLAFPESIRARITEEHDRLETSEVKTLLAPKHRARERKTSPEQLETISRNMQLARNRVLQSDSYVNTMQKTRSNLSIAGFEKQLLETISQNQVTILCGTTGCGKSTQVPQYLLDDMIRRGKGAETNILITQPRRISAISIAERVAAERMQSVRDEVGYSIRLDNSAGKHMTFMTTGILMSLMVSDPALTGITHLIIDEIHERDVNCDVILSLVKKLCERRSDLRIILMSATMQSKLFAAYFEGAPILNVEGRMFPVKTFYLEDLQQMVKRSPTAHRDLDTLANYIHEVECSNASRPMKLDPRVISMAVRQALATEPVARENAILVFVPGWSDIIETERELLADGPGKYHIIRLHSSVSMSGQRACFAPTPPGKTKVIISTNIAESGITIDGVTVVIDAAMSFLTYYTRRNSKSSFVTEMKKIICSKASMTQRMGRAGRTQQGRYFCLITKELYEDSPNFHTAEILRVALDNVILRLLGMGFTDAPKLLESFIEPPPQINVEQAMDDLKELGALDEQGQLTLIGYHLAKVPTDPRQSKILITSLMLGCLESGMTAVATTEQDPFSTNRDIKKEVRASKKLFAMGTNSDHLARVNAVHSWLLNGSLTRSHHLDEFACKKLLQYKEQYRKVLSDSLHVQEATVGRESFSTVCLRAAVASGYFPKVALSNKDSAVQQGRGAAASVKTFITKTDRGIGLASGSAIDPKSPNLPSPFYIVYDSIFIPPMTGPIFSNATFVTMMELVLIATPITRIKYYSEFSLAVVDGWIPFVVTEKQFEALKKLKNIMDVRVWQKLEDPTNLKVDEVFRHSMQIVKDVLFLSAKSNDQDEEDADESEEREEEEEDEGITEKKSSNVGMQAALAEYAKTVVDFTKDTAATVADRLNAAAAVGDE